jgi:hypothetical protein
MRFLWLGLYWLILVSFGLIVTLFVFAIPYSIVNYVQGGLPEVKSWLIHIRTEGNLEQMMKGQDYWTWQRLLIPYACYLAAGIILWLFIRSLRTKLYPNKN